jgi:hypothetical protein
MQGGAAHKSLRD